MNVQDPSLLKILTVRLNSYPELPYLPAHTWSLRAAVTTTSSFFHNWSIDKFWSILVPITNDFTKHFEIFSHTFPIFWSNHFEIIVSTRHYFNFKTSTMSVDTRCLSNCLCWVQPLKILNLRLYSWDWLKFLSKYWNTNSQCTPGILKQDLKVQGF